MLTSFACLTLMVILIRFQTYRYTYICTQYICICSRQILVSPKKRDTDISYLLGKQNANEEHIFFFNILQYFSTSINPLIYFLTQKFSVSLILFSSGATWISEILDLIYNNGDVEKCKRDAIYKGVPFMELIIPRLTNGNFS